MGQAQVEGYAAENGRTLASRSSASGARGSRWLQVKEVAALLDLHPVTVRRKILRGDLPAYRLGPKGAAVRVDRLELERWLYGDPEQPA